VLRHKPGGVAAAAWTLRSVSRRADLLDASRILEEAALDKYVFLRDAYLQRRRSQVYDGNPPRAARETPRAETEESAPPVPAAAPAPPAASVAPTVEAAPAAQEPAPKHAAPAAFEAAARMLEAPAAPAASGG
jgi:phospholipid-binding lipoprotein MlaA